MPINVETTKGLERKVTFTLDPAQIQQKIDARVKELSGSLKLDGFRKGKIPASVIKNKFGPQVEHEAITEVTQITLSEALQEKKLAPVASPQVEFGDYNAGKPMAVTAIFEVYPAIKLSNVSKLKIEKVSAEITDGDMTAAIDKLRKQAADWEAVERKAQNGDRLTIDFEGTIKNEPIQGGKASDFHIELGSNQLIPGFEEGLVGATKDQSLTLKLKFPKDYFEESLAGKKTEFAVTVKAVEAPKLPEVNEEFVKNYGIKDGKVESLNAEIRKNLERDRDFVTTRKLQQQVFDKLLDSHKFDVPKALIESEKKHLAEQAEQRKQPALDEKALTEKAQRQVALGLLLSEFIKHYELKVDQQKVMEKIQSIASGYQDPAQVLSWYKENKELMRNMEASVLEEQLVEKIVSEAQLKEKAVKFSDLMSEQ